VIKVLKRKPSSENRNFWGVFQAQVISGYDVSPVELVTVVPFACPSFILKGWCKVEKEGQKIKVSLASKDGHWEYRRLNPGKITREDVSYMLQELSLNMTNERDKKFRDELYARVPCSDVEMRVMDAFKELNMEYKCDIFWADLSVVITKAFGKKWQGKNFDPKKVKELHNRLLTCPAPLCFQKQVMDYGVKREMTKETFYAHYAKKVAPMIKVAIRIYDYVRRQYEKHGRELFHLPTLFDEYFQDKHYHQDAVTFGDANYAKDAIDYLKYKALCVVEPDLIYTLPKPHRVNNQLKRCLMRLDLAEGNPQKREDNVPCIPSSTLTEEQQRFLKHVMVNKISFLEGPPGTGKTEVLVALFAEFSKVLVVTYVGMMVDQLQKRLGARNEPTAHTIHSICCQNEFNKAQPWLSQYEVLIIDEGSNVDSNLLRRLLESTTSICRIIIVGDLGQIHPIKPGTPFMDLTLAFPQHSFVLTENKRVDKDSRLLAEAASLIRQGKSRDIQFNVEPCLQYYPTKQEGLLKHLLFEVLNIRTQEDVMNFQIVTLKNKEREQLNKEIEQLLLEKKIIAKVNVISLKDFELYPGLKIQFTKNKKPFDGYDGSRNGEIGQIESILKQGKSESILFLNNGKKILISYSNDKAVQPWDIILGYGGTSNKVQGSEWNNVIFWIYSDPKPFFTFPYAYVAISRARQKAIVVADSLNDFHKICSGKPQPKQTLFRYYLEHEPLESLRTMIPFEKEVLKDPFKLQLLSREKSCVPLLLDSCETTKKGKNKKFSGTKGQHDE
jgi:hypothetical protein